MSKYYIDVMDYEEKLARVPMEFRTFRKAVEVAEYMPTVKAIPLDKVEQILEKYKLRIPPTVYYELLADVRNYEVSE